LDLRIDESFPEFKNTQVVGTIMAADPDYIPGRGHTSAQDAPVESELLMQPESLNVPKHQAAGEGEGRFQGSSQKLWVL
jgi:hypothetical protein